MDEQELARLPYAQTPAQAEDVAKEVRNLAALVAGIMLGARDAQLGARLIEDGKKEPGTSVVVQELRLALALNSWAGQEIETALKMFGDVLPRFFAEAFEAAQREAGG